MKDAGTVILKVYNVLGNLVTTLINSETNAGLHEINFNAENLASGIYFYQLKSGVFLETRKMLLLK